MKINVNGTKLNVTDNFAHHKTAFIWAHGLMGNIDSEYEAHVLPFDKIGEDYRLIRYDARGHGDSDDELSARSHRWDILADDLLAIADHLNLDQFFLGGTSKGAATALWAAIKAPERIKGLVIKLPPDAWFLRRNSRLQLDRIKHTLHDLGIDTFCNLMQEAHVPPIMSGLENQKALDIKKLRRRSLAVVEAIIQGAIESDLPAMEHVASIKIPTMILAWTGMPGHPIEIAEELHALIEGSKLFVANNSAEVIADNNEVLNFIKNTEATKREPLLNKDTECDIK